MHFFPSVTRYIMKGQQAFVEVTHALCASTTIPSLASRGLPLSCEVHGRDHHVHRDLTTMPFLFVIIFKKIHWIGNQIQWMLGFDNGYFFHLVWEPFCRMDHPFSPFFTVPDHLIFWVDRHTGENSNSSGCRVPYCVVGTEMALSFHSIWF